MKKPNLVLTPMALLVAGVLAGCSVAAIPPIKEEADKGAATAVEHLNSIRASRKVETAAPKPVAQHFDTDVYIPVRKMAASKLAKASQDPALARQITVNRTFVSAQELAERITALSGVPVIVSPDVTAMQPGQTIGQMGVAGGVPGMQGQAMTGLPSLPPLPSAGSIPGSNGMASPFGTAYGAVMQPGGFPVNLSYTGSLSGFLDVTSSRIGISWELLDGQIRLFRYVSKTFRLSALPGDTSMDAKVGTTSSTGGAGGIGSSGSSQSSSSAQNSGVNFSGLSVWKGIEDSVKAMLTPAGKIVVASALGTITVTDTPAIVSAVEKFIEQQNLALSRQVVVNVRVLSIDMNTSDSYGINWDVVYTALSNNFGFGFNSGVAAIQGAGNLALSVLSTAGQSTNSTIKAWAGSKAIIEALGTQGKVSTVTSASVTTLNNQPAPIQVGRQTSYVASSSTSITTGVATTSMTAGMVNSGFSMSLLPHIIDGNRMLLQYAVDMSSLLSLNTVSSGSSIMQTPDVDTRNSLQRIMVNSGDTIVVAGFENSEVNAKSQGVAGAENPSLGGSVVGKRSKNIIVILLQPVIAE